MLEALALEACSILAWVGWEEVFGADAALRSSSGSSRWSGRESLIRRSSTLKLPWWEITIEQMYEGSWIFYVR